MTTHPIATCTARDTLFKERVGCYHAQLDQHDGGETFEESSEMHCGEASRWFKLGRCEWINVITGQWLK
jgi:hypothetical protein